MNLSFIKLRVGVMVLGVYSFIPQLKVFNNFLHVNCMEPYIIIFKYKHQ